MCHERGKTFPHILLGEDDPGSPDALQNPGVDTVLSPRDDLGDPQVLEYRRCQDAALNIASDGDHRYIGLLGTDLLQRF